MTTWPEELDSVLITGGTGSFGKAFLRWLLAIKNGPNRVVVFSRDELKQHDMKAEFQDPRIRWFIGDVRDSERIHRAFKDIKLVVHAAALKQVDTAEYNPYEFVKTNVLGTQNIIDAAIDCGVLRVLALSTDKASSPINLYGATKLTADKLIIAGNVYAGSYPTRLAVVRYGNVMASRGSVIPVFQRMHEAGVPIQITDPAMTRFGLTITEAVEFVASSIDLMQGGELFVPKIPSFKVTDLAEAISPGRECVYTGIRPGEKLHEEMISRDDSFRTVELSDRYVVEPVLDRGFYHRPAGATSVEPGWSYSSDNNDEWLSVEDLRSMVATTHAS